jgi:protein-S-isoprenylcysteine O-methyltransferase Ste14
MAATMRETGAAGAGDRRAVDLAIGYGSVALFAVSIGILFWFLITGVDRPEPYEDALDRGIRRVTEGRGDARATFNILLVVAWGFLHSLLARPRFKERIHRLAAAHLEPAIYSLVAGAGLVAVCLLYRPIGRVVWALDGGAALLVRLLFYAGWALFVYCWFHLDLMEVAGLRPILRQHEGAARPSAPFRPGGPFLWVRHPVELAFLIVFWAAPTMTVGHLLFASVMTLYTFVGIDLEDRKMLVLQGAEYLDYVKRVPQILPLPR